MKKKEVLEESSNDLQKEKQKALDIAIEQIEKKFGKGSIMKMSDDSSVLNVGCISSGSIQIDEALGVGGFPKGRIIEIYGPESSGKTTLALHVAAQAQKNGGKVAFIDAEHALDPTYAQKIGIKQDGLMLSQPDSGEQALEIADTLARSGAVEVIIIDSVAALTPESEIKGDMGQMQVGGQARLMSSGLRKLASVVAKSKTLVIFINQIRMKIGVMFGSPETTSGGNALKFYASIRVEVRRGEAITGTGLTQDQQSGSKMNIKVVKNKVAPPFRRASVDICYGEGISRIDDIIDSAIKVGIIQKAGSWFSYEDKKIGQGKENVKKFLNEDKALIDDIEKRTREIIFSKLNKVDPTPGENDLLSDNPIDMANEEDIIEDDIEL